MLRLIFFVFVLLNSFSYIQASVDEMLLKQMEPAACDEVLYGHLDYDSDRGAFYCGGIELIGYNLDGELVVIVEVYDERKYCEVTMSLNKQAFPTTWKAKWGSVRCFPVLDR